MGNFTTSEAIVAKAGANRSTAITEVMFNRWIQDAENLICTECRYDLIVSSEALLTKYPHFIPTIGTAASAHAAQRVVQYDMGGYTTRTEAENIINLNFDEEKRATDALKKIVKQKENIV